MNLQHSPSGSRPVFLPAVCWVAGISLLMVSLFGCIHIAGMGYLGNWELSTPSLYVIEANVQNALDTIWGNPLLPEVSQETFGPQTESSQDTTFFGTSGDKASGQNTQVLPGSAGQEESLSQQEAAAYLFPISFMNYLSGWMTSNPLVELMGFSLQEAIDHSVQDALQQYPLSEMTQVDLSSFGDQGWKPRSELVYNTTINDYEDYAGSFQYLAYSSVYRTVSSNTGLYDPQLFLDRYEENSAIIIQLKNGLYQVTIQNYQPTLWEQICLMLGLAGKENLVESQQTKLETRLQNNTYVWQEGSYERDARDAYLLFCVPKVPTGAGRLTQIYNGYFSGRSAVLNFTGLSAAAGAACLAVSLTGRRQLWQLHQKLAQKSAGTLVEIKLAVLVAALAGGYGTLASLGSNWDSHSTQMSILFFWLSYPVFCEIFLLRGNFFKHNSMAFFHGIWRKNQLKYRFGRKMRNQLLLLFAVEGCLILFGILFLFTGAVTSNFGSFVCSFLSLLCAGGALVVPLIYLRSYSNTLKQFEAIIDQVERIREGDFSHPLEFTPDQILYPAADSLNYVQTGMRRAVAEQVKSEKMKVELITNVSHDLKTPLTSIINYADLLSKENLTPDYANDYVKILKQKADRLKTLVQDLFDISKANSGEIIIKTQKIDVQELLEQTIAELDNWIKQSGLLVKTEFPGQRVWIEADGHRMHRVFENLLVNALNYSLTGSRIYIALSREETWAKIVFKNVAGYEMNFSADEITERFVRGDSSRTAEGSGLGLAIVKSFVALHGGEFGVEIDGDLFKATVWLPALEEPEESAKDSPQIDPDFQENPDC